MDKSWSGWLAVLILSCFSAHLYADTVLKVGVYENEPKIFANAQGHPDGLFVDLLEGIARNQQWSLEYVFCEWQKCLADLESGRIDLLPDVAWTAERAELFDFHREAALHSWSQLYSRPGANYQSVFQLEVKRVALLERSVQQAEFEEMMEDFGISVSIVGVSHYDRAFELLQQGDVDVAVVNFQYGAYRAADYGLELTPIVFQPVSLFFAATRGRHGSILDAIDQQLNLWRQSPRSYYFTVIDRWQPPSQPVRLPTVVWWIMAFLGAVLSILLAAAFWLRREVERKTQALRLNEQKLNTILDSVGAYIFIKDTSFRYQYVNRLFKERTRSIGVDLLGKRDEEVFGSETAALLHKTDVAVFDQARPLTVEETLPGQNGETERTYLSVKIPLRNEKGVLYGLCGISTDITDRKQAEESRRLAATVFQSQEAMVIADASRIILDSNTAFCEMTGYSAQVLNGRRLDHLVSRHQDKTFYQTVWSAVLRVGHWRGHLWLRTRKGKDLPVRMMVSAVVDASEKVSHYVLTLHDVTEERVNEERIRKLAFTDTLTGLANRHALLDRLDSLQTAGVDSPVALLILDVDDFKDINDILGHDKGDDILRQIATRLKRLLVDDLVVRLASDEFAVLRFEEHCANRPDINDRMLAYCNRIKSELEEEYDLGNDRYRCSVTVGLSLWEPGQRAKLNDLLKQADLALHQAKESESRGIQLYTPALQLALRARYDLEMELRQAIEKDEFHLVYQPQVDGQGKPCGVEALIRWQHPERGIVSPADFIPIAEHSGLIIPLGRWVIAQSCRQLAIWSKDQSMAELSCAVNVSARQFRAMDFVEHLAAMLEETGVPAQRLKIELTETLLLDDIEGAVEKITALNQLGVNVSLDDFGTGYSSLSYLKRLPLTQLKIDQTFVSDIMRDTTAAMIARSIIGLGDSLQLDVIAEGVETMAQFEWLREAGCNAYQGYLFARPIEAAQVESWVASQRLCTF